MKSWWANAIHPPQAESATWNKEKIDTYRYEKCVRFLNNKQLTSRSIYRNLISSGSLRYISQATIELRNQANTHAHDLGTNMSRFRRVLHTTKSTHNHLCSASEFVHINGIVDFLEVLEKDKKKECKCH